MDILIVEFVNSKESIILLIELVLIYGLYLYKRIHVSEQEIVLNHV